MNVPSLIFWVLIVLGLRSRGPFLIYVFFAALPFETTAVIPPAIVGGVTLTPGWTTMAFLAPKILLMQPNLSGALKPLANLRQIGSLSLCTLYGAGSAFFLPRMFAGQVDVFAMRAELSGAVALQPTPANITQTFYFIMTTFGVLTFYLVGRAPQLRRHLLNAILVGGVVTIVTGLVDLATSAVGAGWLLAPFRTASYAYLVGAEVVGARRLVGLCSEASAFSALCMSFAGPIFFLRETFARPLTRNILAPLVFLTVVVMLALSTSSTGYVGLGVLAALIVVYGVWQSLKGRPSGWRSLAFAYGAAAAIFAIVMVRADLLARAAELIDQMVLHKTTTSSYIDRTAWNEASLQALAVTHGLGAGLGSVRASSWLFSILGNIGVIGAALMLVFLILTFMSRPASVRVQDQEVVTGAKAALVPILAMASLSGTSVGFDLMPACLFGLIGALSWDAIGSGERRRRTIGRTVGLRASASRPAPAHARRSV